jgi:hypothetical protein
MPKLYACPFCGSEAHWNPAEHALVCISCDARSPANVELGAAGETLIQEHALAVNLREAPDTARGWQAAKTEMRCDTCGAISVFDPNYDVAKCDFCGASAFVALAELKQSLRPESVLEFKITEGEARESVRRWYAQRWLAPKELQEKALTDTVRGLYIPYWTFDATAVARWRSPDGSLHPFAASPAATENGAELRFDDVLVPASRGLNHDALITLEPFPTAELKAYHPGFVAGWVVERYQLDLANAAVVGRQRMNRDLETLYAQQTGRKFDKTLRFEASYSEQTFKLILVPVWILNYLFRGEPYQILVNGYTGKITGSYPTSETKSSMAAVLGIITLALLAWKLPLNVLLVLGIPALFVGWLLHRARKQRNEVFSPSEAGCHVRSDRSK